MGEGSTQVQRVYRGIVERAAAIGRIIMHERERRAAVCKGKFFYPATSECILPYLLHSGGDGERLDGVAIVEGLASDAVNCGKACDGLQRLAALECVSLDNLQLVGYVNRLHGTTATKGISTHGLYLVPHVCGQESRATVEGILTYVLYILAEGHMLQ